MGALYRYGVGPTVGAIPEGVCPLQAAPPLDLCRVAEFSLPSCGGAGGLSGEPEGQGGRDTHVSVSLWSAITAAREQGR